MVTENKQIPDNEVRFEDMPAMLLKLSERVKKMSEHIISISSEMGKLQGNKKEWLTLDMLIEYLLIILQSKLSMDGWLRMLFLITRLRSS